MPPVCLLAARAALHDRLCTCCWPLLYEAGDLRRSPPCCSLPSGIGGGAGSSKNKKKKRKEQKKKKDGQQEEGEDEGAAGAAGEPQGCMRWLHCSGLGCAVEPVSHVQVWNNNRILSNCRIGRLPNLPFSEVDF